VISFRAAGKVSARHSSMDVWRSGASNGQLTGRFVTLILKRVTLDSSVRPRFSQRNRTIARVSTPHKAPGEPPGGGLRLPLRPCPGDRAYGPVRRSTHVPRDHFIAAPIPERSAGLTRDAASLARRAYPGVARVRGAERPAPARTRRRGSESVRAYRPPRSSPASAPRLQARRALAPRPLQAC
jgi:hypothetical protein